MTELALAVKLWDRSTWGNWIWSKQPKGAPGFAKVRLLEVDRSHLQLRSTRLALHLRSSNESLNVIEASEVFLPFGICSDDIKALRWVVGSLLDAHVNGKWQVSRKHLFLWAEQGAFVVHPIRWRILQETGFIWIPSLNLSRLNCPIKTAICLVSVWAAEVRFNKLEQSCSQDWRCRFRHSIRLLSVNRTCLSLNKTIESAQGTARKIKKASLELFVWFESNLMEFVLFAFLALCY